MRSWLLLRPEQTPPHLSSVLRIFHIWSSSLDWRGMLAASIKPSCDPSWLMLWASGSILFFSSSASMSMSIVIFSSSKTGWRLFHNLEWWNLMRKQTGWNWSYLSPAPDYNARQTLPKKASWEIYIGRNALLQKKSKKTDEWQMALGIAFSSPDAASTSSPLLVQQQAQRRPKRIRTPWRASAEKAK